MKWIGQYIYDQIAKFRSDVYLEGLSTTTETNVLVVDSTGKVSKSTSVAGDLTSIVAGTGLSGTDLTGPIPTLNVDASIPEITTLAGLTSFGSAGATTNIVAGDLTVYNNVNNGDPTLSLGSSSTNRFEIETVYSGSGTNLAEVNFTSYTSNLGAQNGKFNWYVDEVKLGVLNDSGMSAYGYLASIDNAASSATAGGKLTLRSDDGAAMADDHRLGVIEFRGAEDASNNLQTGASIQAMCDAAWSASENGTRLEFYTMDGNASSELSLTLDSNLLATFAGGVTVTGTITGDVTGDLTGEADTVATIAGLAPNTAPTGTFLLPATAAAQTNITSLGTLTALTVDNISIDGDTITASGDLEIGATGNDITVDTDNFVITSATSQKPFLELKNTTNDNKGSVLQFTKDKGAAGVDNDAVGIINFKSDDAAQAQTNFAEIRAQVSEADNTDEAGKLTLSVAESNGTSTQLTAGLVLEGEHATDGEVDVTIAAGAASTTTIAGTLTMGSTATIDNSGVVQVAAQTVIDHDQLANFAAGEHYTQANITTVGTIGTGVWNGTKVTDIYTNSSGKRYGSTIKILPSDFMINDDVASPLSFKDGSNSGIHVNDSGSEAIAFVTIPEGMKATLVDVYGTHNKTLKVWEVNVHESFDFTGSTKGTGAMNTQLDITDVDSTADNYLAIQVTLTATSQRIWGGRVTIAAI